MSEKKKINLLKTAIAAVSLCITAAVTFYLRANVAEMLILKCEEKGKMENMIWCIEHLFAIIPAFAIIGVLSLIYYNREKYVPVITQREKLIAVLLCALFLFGAIMPYAFAAEFTLELESTEAELETDAEEDAEGEDAKEEEEVRIIDKTVNWFAVQILPLAILAAYHGARIETEKRELAEAEAEEAQDKKKSRSRRGATAPEGDGDADGENGNGGKEVEENNE